jgi:diguanylate cyclase (GGDEF)-like protein
MTLFKQIAALISVVFIILLGVTTWNDFRHSTNALEGQLKTAAQNMATTLGVSIANSEQGTDPAYIETLFNVIFDSGYLTKIEMVSPTGEQMHVKEQPVAIQGVPDWFIELADIDIATGETQIMANWIPYGTLRLTLHPGYAYSGLYKNLKGVMIWFAVLAVSGLIVLWILLHLILRPLKFIKKQADAIGENRFIQNEHTPRTVELKSVVLAMNRMVNRVQTVFNEQVESLNRYHTQLYRDALTGLGNRKHMLDELDEICKNEGGAEGFLVVMAIHDFSKVKEQIGYKRSDRLVVELARMMEDVVGKQARKYCARMSDSEFSMYLQGDVGTVEIRTQKVFDAFKALTVEEQIEDITWLYAGLAAITADSTTGNVLSAADFALTQAKVSGEYKIFHEIKSDLSLPQGKMEWHHWLEESLQKHHFFLAGQPANNRESELDHIEVFVRLRDEQGQLIPAGVFMPVANVLGIDFSIEVEVLRIALEVGKQNPETPIAINISSMFFTDAHALAKLEQFMKEAVAANIKIQIEASHFTITQHPQAAEAIADRIKHIGCTFGIDNMDLSLNMDMLQALLPNYVKVNTRTLMDMVGEAGSAGMQNLRSLTSGLGIRLIAVGIDSQEELDTMVEAGVDAVQGYFIGKPEELK